VTARCGSLRLPLQRLTVESQRSSTVTRARPGSRGVRVPFRGPAVTRVAPSWLRALPPRRSRRPRGLSRATSLPRREPRETLSWSSLPLQSRTASRLPALRDRRDRLRGPAVQSSPGIASPGVLSPLEHMYAGCPLSHPPQACAHSREGEGYQALTGAVLRVLAPLDGSGCTRGTHQHTPCGMRSPFSVTPRRFAALFHAARAHWSRPTELSLPEEPYPLSRALSPLWVGADRPTARLDPRVSRPLSPIAPTSRRSWPEGSLDWRSRDDGSLESLGRRTCHVAVVVCDVSSRNGRARRTRQPARPLRSFSHLESPFADTDRRPGQGAINRSVLSWAFFPSRAFSSSPWVRCARGPMKSGRTRAPPVLETQAPGHMYSPGPGSGRGV